MSPSNQKGAQLEPFDRRRAATILGWVSSPNELMQWSSRSDFPLSDVAVFDLWHADPEITAYVLLFEHDLVGYGEVWLDEAAGSVELGRIIVAPQKRRQGVGRALVQNLCDVIGDTSVPIWVRVMPTNDSAVAFYKSLGFVRGSSEQEMAWNSEQRFPFIWMARCG